MSIGVKTAMSDQEHQQPQAESSTPRPQDRSQRDHGRRRHRNSPRYQEASINMKELRELIELITDNGLMEFELEREGFHVKIGRNVHSDLGLPEPGAGSQSIEGRSATGATAQ